MLIALNSMLRRRGRGALPLLVVLALGGSVTIAHSALGAGHMGAMAGMPAVAMGHDTAAMSHPTGGDGSVNAVVHPVLMMCVAVLTAAAVVLAALDLARVAGRGILLPRATAWPPPPPALLADAGPVPRPRPPDRALLQVFRH